MLICPKYWSLEIRFFECKQTNEFITNIDGDYDNTDDDAELVVTLLHNLGDCKGNCT